MARTDTLTLAPGWTQLTNSDVTAISIQNQSQHIILLLATAGEVTPTSTNGARNLLANQTLAADMLLSDIWPGVSGANRVYAYVPHTPCIVAVSHA